MKQDNGSSDELENLPEFLEAEISLSDVRLDDIPVFLIFWILAFVVFLQFFTRYVLNDSLGWTEEIARFLLIGVAFLGAVMATRKQSHIAVEFLYRYVPRQGRKLAQLIIDLVNVAFFGLLTVLTIQISGRTQQMMVSIDVPKAYMYWVVVGCFAAMTLYACLNTWRHWQTGTSRLIDPELHADKSAKVE